ncbi:hypothetical protein GCM10027182_21670 [Aquaspirillum soli]
MGVYNIDKKRQTPPYVTQTGTNSGQVQKPAPAYGNGADQPSKISSNRCACVNDIPHCCNCSGVAARNRDNTQSGNG